MSVTRTFTVTVSNPGSGNKYYIDGVLQATVELAEGGTYKFDQSDATNGGHPLVFSSDSGNSTPYTTGVTTNGTPGNAGAYTQIVVAQSAPTLYYYCSNHAGMGGQANTPTGDAWGLLSWSAGDWGDQNDFTVEVSGIQSSLSQGSFTIELNTNEPATGQQLTGSTGQVGIELINNGWGANTWGFSQWGQIGQQIVGQQATLTVGNATAAANADVDVTGSQAATTISSTSVSINQEVTPASLTLTSSVGNVDPEPDAMVVGQQAALSIGSVTVEAIIEEGWGGDTWGENRWGDLQAHLFIVGQQAQLSIGNAVTQADAIVNATGIQLTATNAGAVGGTSVDLIPTGQQLTMSLGDETINVGVPVTTAGTLTPSAGQTTIDPTFLIGEGWGRDTYGNLGWGVNYSAINTGGLQLTSSLGSETAFTDVVVSVTGQQANMTLGVYSTQADADLSITVSEHTMNTSIGNFSLVQSTVEPATGQQLGASVGTAEGFQNTPVDVSGNEATLTQGTISLEQSTVETATGQQLTTSIGTVSEVPAQMVGVSGIQATLSMGEEGTVSNANVFPTGISLTATTGNTKITSWNEVETGVNNTWSVVDLAA